MSLLVNLFGQPGAGKSTGAAYVFSKLKLDNIKCELVTEFAKDCVWRDEKEAFRNNYYIFSNQLYKIMTVYEKVDVVITDSPILLATIYSSPDSLFFSKHYEPMIYDFHKCFNNLNFLVKRVKPYVSVGRNQTEKESDEISRKVELLFAEIGGTVVEGNEDGYQKIYEGVKQCL